MTATSFLRDRIQGGVLGLLVGDALGVPYEFQPASSIPPLHEIDFSPPPGFSRSHAGVPPATWSDDGAQALCLLASLLEVGRFDARDFGARLVRWYDQGYMAVDGFVFDVGVTSGIAIRSMRLGADPETAGASDSSNNGNGALMRVLPLALWHRGSDSDLVRDAHAQARVTHGHMRSQVCCGLYCLWARRILQGMPDPWQDAVRTIRSIYARSPEETEELEWSVRPDEPPEGQGSGYVVDSLRSARLSCGRETYEEVVRSAVALGNDTDTTACIAGGIAGIRYGVEAIPERWRTSLRGQEIYQPLLDRLVEVTAHIHP